MNTPAPGDFSHARFESVSVVTVMPFDDGQHLRQNEL